MKYNPYFEKRKPYRPNYAELHGLLLIGYGKQPEFEEEIEDSFEPEVFEDGYN